MFANECIYIYIYITSVRVTGLKVGFNYILNKSIAINIYSHHQRWIEVNMYEREMKGWRERERACFH